MARRRTRKTFVELVREVGSVAATRDLSKRRIAARRRRALAPTDPLAAIAQLKGAGARFATSAQKLFDRHIVPVTFPGTSRQLFEEAVAVFGRELDALAVRAMPSARAAASKASKHANREYARIMGVQLPTTGVQTGGEGFALQVVQAFRKIAADQTAALLNPPDLESFSSEVASLRHRLWIVQNRVVTVAQSNTEDFFQKTFRMWTTRGGDQFSIWVTKRDGRVRHSHKERDGKVFPNAVGLGGIWPGQEVNCRCGSLPASVELV